MKETDYMERPILKTAKRDKLSGKLSNIDVEETEKYKINRCSKKCCMSTSQMLDLLQDKILNKYKIIC